MVGGMEIVLRLVLGALMGGLIGVERQAHGRPAGFRTHMLVCVSSVLIMLVSEHVSQTSLAKVPVDPGRIAAGAITGIGFLGAGVIVRMGATVTGLTTAACIWMVSAIGLAIGAGMYAASAVSFVLTFLILTGLRLVESWMPRNEYRQVAVTAGPGVAEDALHGALDAHCRKVYAVDHERDVTTGEVLCHATVLMKRGVHSRALLDALTALPGVRRASVRES
jgi:putative Mg2+ transporter-C (MgtC) family protein